MILAILDSISLPTFILLLVIFNCRNHYLQFIWCPLTHIPGSVKSDKSDDEYEPKVPNEKLKQLHCLTLCRPKDQGSESRSYDCIHEEDFDFAEYDYAMVKLELKYLDLVLTGSGL